jgi:hypothetical protein
LPSRSVVGLLGRTDRDGTKNTDATSEMVKHLSGAFAKPAADERLIFIDVNTDRHPNPRRTSRRCGTWSK